MARMDCAHFMYTRIWYVREFEDFYNFSNSARGILQMRLYALYSLDKRMLAVVVASFVAALTVSGYILTSILSKVKGTFKLEYRTLDWTIRILSVGRKFAIWWDALLCPLCPSNILLVLDPVDGFWVPTPWSCHMQRFADSEAQWITRSQGGSHSSPGFCCVFSRVSVQKFYFLSCSTSNSSKNRICITYGVCLVFGIFAPVCFLGLGLFFFSDHLLAGVTYRRSDRLYYCDAVCS